MKLKAFKLKTLLNVSFWLIFWVWNLTFLTVVYFGILIPVGVDLVVATFDGEVPFDFFVTFMALIAIPTVCTLLGWKYLRLQPKELMRLFYGVEAPLFTLCLVRLFLIRELTAASALLLGTLLVCIAAFSFEILWGFVGNRRPVAWLQLVAHNLMLLVGAGVGILLLFYAIPVAGVSLEAFFKFEWLEGLASTLYYSGPIGLLFLLLFGFSCTLFVGMPVAFFALYVHSGQRLVSAFAHQYGSKRAWGAGFSAILVWLIWFNAFNVQPQVKALQLLENVPQTDNARHELLAQSDAIRKGLVNAYLHPYRYLSTTKENNHIYAIYRDVFGVSDSVGGFLQERYNQVMSPFLYQGSTVDKAKAAQLYEEFFDTPLQKRERLAVQHALQSTAIIDQAKAGLMNIDQKRVWLREQQVNVNPHGNWADVEIYELYENKTTDVEEIFYYFSLPESAVITGLWLGESKDLEQRFPFQVSPRGAAQQVYNSQVRRQRPIDPALLEQVGPRNYRLRAFPVPAPLTNRERRNGVERATEMHLWLTYKVMRQEKGWALPKLQEKRNIFWTKGTKRFRNGEQQPGFADNWLEASIPAQEESLAQLQQVNFSNGYNIAAKPVSEQKTSLSTGQKFALIMDDSRSMAAHLQQLKETFVGLKQQGWLKNNDFDLYLSAAQGKEPQRLDDISKFNLSKQVFYGSLQTAEILQQFEQLRGETDYDALIVLSDEGSYELAKDEQEVPAISAPLWLVHLGDNMPRAYDDATLKAIQDTQGGVAENLATVLESLAVKRAWGDEVITVADGYAWVMETGNASATTKEGFAPLAARQLVTRMSRQTSSPVSVEELDGIHKVAKENAIVTPYSSMIVLVNDEQRKMLKEAEASEDRFAREVETGKETLDQPFDAFTVSGVPEPEEWILIGLGAIALVVIAKRRKLKLEG